MHVEPIAQFVTHVSRNLSEVNCSAAPLQVRCRTLESMERALPEEPAWDKKGLGGNSVENDISEHAICRAKGHALESVQRALSEEHGTYQKGLGGEGLENGISEHAICMADVRTLESM